MENETLDTSWVQEYDKLLNIQQHYKKEPMKTLYSVYIYVDSDKQIQKINTEKLNLHIDTSGSFLLKEDLLKIIQDKKQLGNKKYKLDDIMLYHIPLEHENISTFNEKEEFNESFFKPVSFFDSLKIPDSIFIFHELNTIYFLFSNNLNNHNYTIKSILKCPNREPNKNMKTKKVQIIDAPVVIYKKKKQKKTKKNRTQLHS